MVVCLTIELQVARVGLEGSHPSEMTGTPLFMALSVAWGSDPHSVSSELESLMYALLYIASDGKVRSRVDVSWLK